MMGRAVRDSLTVSFHLLAWKSRHFAVPLVCLVIIVELK